MGQSRVGAPFVDFVFLLLKVWGKRANAGVCTDRATRFAGKASGRPTGFLGRSRPGERVWWGGHPALALISKSNLLELFPVVLCGPGRGSACAGGNDWNLIGRYTPVDICAGMDTVDKAANPQRGQCWGQSGGGGAFPAYEKKVNT